MTNIRGFIITAIILAIISTMTLLNYHKKEQLSDTKGTKIVASFYPVYIMAKNVAKDVPGVTVTNLTPPVTGCLHDYTVTANDMKNLSDAKVFVINGASMESFMDNIISMHPELKIIELSKGIPLITGDGEEGDNPHLWVSISNAITQVENLCAELAAFDPGNKELYEKNTADYVAKLDALRQTMHSELAQYKGTKIITFHEAFPYFAREFELEIAAVVEREPGSAPSAKELAETIDLIKSSGIPAIFCEPQYPAAAAQTIANESGIKVYVLDPAVTGPDDYDAYINIMQSNLKVLKEALSK